VSSYLNDILWALVGLILTIGGTFVEVFVTNFPWDWSNQGIQTQALGVSCQIGAVLLIGCLGGKKPAIISQIAYLFLGLTFLPVFSLGGGLGYIFEPSFGYLLGFIPASWLCGLLAFRAGKLKLEQLAFSCLVGLLVIHFFGMIYLVILSILNLLDTETITLSQAIINYSVYPVPGQLILICAVVVIAFIFRLILLHY
jgi:biotin transport system substrate-specific component